MKTTTCWRVFLFATALTLAAPTAASGQDRLFGFGWNGALGVYATDSDDPGFAFDVGVEFRLFPNDRFSFDINFDIAEAAAVTQLRTFFHIHARNDLSKTYFSLAPFISVQGSPSDSVLDDYDVFGLGSRVGMEVLNDSEAFGMGLYFRPGLYYHGAHEELFGEFVLEMTWIIYPPTPL